MTKLNRIYIAIILINLLKIVNCFNLETRLPIIKNGEENSYFGYSVAEHIIGNRDESDNTKWLLVGAPLGQNLQPNTTLSGALYKCPITSDNNDCVQVQTDGRNLPGRPYEPSYDDSTTIYPPDLDTEIKTGQWLGVTVRSQGAGGKVLVCAHRFINKVGESQFGQGLCYILTNELDYNDIYKPCEGRSTARAHEEYGYCQVGTSGTILDDDTIILGSPGPYTWRGTIFVISIEDDFLKRDKNHYYGPHTESISPVDKYSYLGMAVTGGRYFGDYMSYATGAPRSNGNGQVIIMSNGQRTKTNPLNVQMTIDGEQFASSFGYELATADINGDNLPDLIVAAPFYFTRHDGGAVYIYQNDDHKLSNTPTLKLTGKLESHFGLAISNMGDINQDSCDDIAIGAPYDGNGAVYIYLGSRNGLSEKPSQIISANDFDNIVPKKITSFGSSLSGGIDLDNNSYPDLLIGAYSSASVVALLARPITKIKTKVNSTELINIDPSQFGCRSDPAANLTCFSFEACCSIEPYESAPTKHLDLIYTIEAETFDNNKKFSRVFFGKDYLNRSNIVQRNIHVYADGYMECHEEIVYVKENTRDIQSPIKFRLNYTIVEPPLPKSGLEMLHPILDQTEADRPFEASFQKDCGNDNICESQLEVFSELELQREDNNYTLVLGQIDELHLNVTVLNHEDSAYESQLFVEHQPSVSYIGSNKGNVICNRFNKTIVVCALGNPLKRDASAKVTLRFDPSGLEDSEPILLFKIFANSTSKQIQPRPPTLLTVHIVKRAELSIKGWAQPEQSFYGGEIRGESAMEYLEDIGTSVQHTYQIYNDGPWRAKYLEVHFWWPHQVANDKPQGKWLLYLEDTPTIEGGGSGECIIQPMHIINPLNLSKRSKLNDVPNDLMTFVDGSDDKLFTNNKSQNVNGESSEKLSTSKYSSATLNRVKRDRSVIIRPERLTDSDGKKTVIVQMDCEKNTTKCVKFHCVIYNLQRKTEAYIHIKSRLWNSTLVSDYPKVDMVNIVSYARIEIPPMFGIEQSKKDDITTVETRAYPELLAKDGDGEVPILIIILAVIGGLLLLAIFTFVLWKCGFFKRRRPDPTLSGNLEKNNENKLLLQNKK